MVGLIAGQELGSKQEHLALAAVGRYEPHRILMVGDAPGDQNAAQANGVLFFPIDPGHEDESWQRFFEEALPRFLDRELRRILHGRPDRPVPAVASRDAPLEKPSLWVLESLVRMQRFNDLRLMRVPESPQFLRNDLMTQ